MKLERPIHEKIDAAGRLLQGASLRQLAKMYGVSPSTIHRWGLQFKREAEAKMTLTTEPLLAVDQPLPERVSL